MLLLREVHLEPHLEHAAAIEAMRASGNGHLSLTRPVPLDNTIHYPWFVSADGLMIAFAHKVNTDVDRIVVFAVEPGKEITTDTVGYVFKLASGEKWMFDSHRTIQRDTHMRRAFRAAAALPSPPNS